MLIDANVILRFLLADDDRQSAEAEEFLLEAPEGSLSLSPLTLAEVTWVLLSHHEVPRELVASALQRVVALPSIRAGDTLLDAVARFAASSVDFADCALAAEAAAQGAVAVSFDKDLRRFSDIRAMRPKEALERLLKR
jgi:predicted nucleic acid-binding protein